MAMLPGTCLLGTCTGADRTQLQQSHTGIVDDYGKLWTGSVESPGLLFFVGPYHSPGRPTMYGGHGCAAGPRTVGIDRTALHSPAAGQPAGMP